MRNTTATAKCQAFAAKHGLVFQPHGEVGFGRECVGFLDQRGDEYVAYLPLDDATLAPIEGFADDRIRAPDGVGAYHKHDCLAVLVHGNDYDGAIDQLAQWVDAMEAIGVEVAEYNGVQRDVLAALSGRLGQRQARPAIRVKP